jgi:hypothetical protein
MGLTLLDTSAALYMVSQIVDATDWTVAREVIALGQLEGGDHTGVLHTATQIPTAVNRNGAFGSGGRQRDITRRASDEHYTRSRWIGAFL